MPTTHAVPIEREQGAVPFDFKNRSSIRTRVTVVTLIIFVLSLWSLSLFATRALRVELQDMLALQQRSTVALLAEQINEELEDRFMVLNTLASKADLRAEDNATGFKQLMSSRPAAQHFFNAGLMLLGPDGTVLADVGSPIQRIGVNYMNVQVVAAALKTGNRGVGPPVMARTSRTPVFSMVVPVRNTQGAVVGALLAVTDLSKPNFLDKVVSHHYGKTGHFELVAAQHRLILNARDKRFILQALEADRVDPLVNRFILGYGGSGIAINPVGVEVLSSAQSIPSANWYVTVTLPTAEAFEPIDRMQQRMLWATIFLTLVASGLTWWWLRRELAPLLNTARTLALQTTAERPLQALPIVRQDEVGSLIASFNRMLLTLVAREAALQQRDRYLSSIVEAIPMQLWTFDGNDFTFVNRRWLSFTGLKSIAGKNSAHLAKLLHPDDLAGATQNWNRHWASKTEHENHFRLRRHDGVYRNFYIKVLPVLDVHGVFMHFQGFALDITERQQYEQTLLAACQEAERASLAKSSFMTSMRHELRNPLNTIMGYAQLLQRDASLSTGQQEQVSELLNGGHRLMRLIKEILDLARTEAGQMALTLEDVMVDAVVDECLQKIKALAAEKNITLVYTEQPAEAVRADPARLRQVLLNLLSNAIKFNRTGGSVHLDVRPQGPHRLRILVTDTGVGIAPERMPQLFQPYSRLWGEDGSIAGTGIGLSISRRMAELMGGSMDVASEVGAGSSFWIELGRSTLAPPRSHFPSVWSEN
jgi:two-component system sensor histidine kinase/response regulator